MMKMDDQSLKEMIEWVIKIQQTPSLTFHEGQRAALMMKLFSDLNLDEVFQDETGNVYARIKGGQRPPMILSAHLDSVISSQNHPAIIENNQVRGPGIADNSLGLASLLAVANIVEKTKNHLPGDLWLVANVCEEGLGNLKGMKDVVKRFGSKVSAYLILEGIGLGFIQTGALGNHRLKIEAETRGGHSWNNFGDPSAIHALVRIAARITRIRIPDKPRCSYNIGVIQGGESINTIASKAEMQIDIRSEDEETLDSLTKRLVRLIKRRKFSGTTISVTEIGSRPSGRISLQHPLILLAKEAIEKQSIAPHLSISSSDASLPISLGYPATCIGITTGKGIHTLNESIDIEPITLGINQLLFLLKHLWDD